MSNNSGIYKSRLFLLFRPSTKIRYTIPNAIASGAKQSKQVKLRIYDILVNEEQSPGQHEVLFDAAGLASGVYIHKLDTPGFTSAKKMILLR